MTVGRAVVLTVALFTCLLGRPAPALACSCAGRAPVPRALTVADAVFVGEVTRVARADSIWGRGWVIARALWAEFWGKDDLYVDKYYRSARYGRVAQVRILENFKGMDALRAVIQTGDGDGDCGYELAKGTQHLFYVYREADALEPGSSFLSVTVCSRTAPVEAAGADVGELRDIVAKSQGGRGRPTRR